MKEKSGWSGLKLCHTQSRSKINEDAHGDGVILLDIGSMTGIFKDKRMV